MFDKLPIYANKIYNRSSDHLEIYDLMNSITKDKDPEYVEEEIFKLANIIYLDYVNNGFGSDWSQEYSLLFSDLDDNEELSYLTSYLSTIEKYSKGYKVDNSEISRICEDLELIMIDILDYIDNGHKWVKLRNNLDY